MEYSACKPEIGGWLAHNSNHKLARKTHHSERCNNTLRQRVSRWVREALACSKNRAQHIGAITLFICHDNLTRATAEIEPYMDSTTLDTARRLEEREDFTLFSPATEYAMCGTLMLLKVIRY